MQFIDLCAGIGGFSLGLEWAGMVCVGQVEIDPYCNKVLNRHWPHVGRHKDIKDIAKNPTIIDAIVSTTQRNLYEGESGICANKADTIDLICGGYPCQPFSIAGKRRGTTDDRYIWPCINSIIEYVKPNWCLFENVIGHISMGLDETLSDLENQGYTTQAFIIPACSVGAPQRRYRVWVIANRKMCSRNDSSIAESKKYQEKRQRKIRGCDCATDIPNTHCQPLENSGNATSRAQEKQPNWNTGTIISPKQTIHRHNIVQQNRIFSGTTEATENRNHLRIGTQTNESRQWDLSKSSIPRIFNGVSDRTHRIKALGNSVVPQVVYEIGHAILAAHEKQ